MDNKINKFELDDWINSLAEAGQRMAEIGASEGAAGNLSVCLNADVDIAGRFQLRTPYRLPIPAPGLAGMTVLVTGSGRRLRDVKRAPFENLGAVLIGMDGLNSWLYTNHCCRFTRPTSEFNTHLAVHQDQMARSASTSLALIHSQPFYLTYLSHIEDYQDESTLNFQILRWQPEAMINFQTGIGVLPFEVPGSNDLMAASVNALRSHELIMWCKHGVMARSASGFEHAVDLIEYAETAARYEYSNLLLDDRSTGLTPSELERIAKAFGLNLPPGY